KTISRFGTVSPFLQAHRQTAVRLRPATQVTFCVRGVVTAVLGVCSSGDRNAWGGERAPAGLSNALGEPRNSQIDGRKALERPFYRVPPRELRVSPAQRFPAEKVDMRWSVAPRVAHA